MELKSILDALPKLQPNELVEVQGRIKALLQFTDQVQTRLQPIADTDLVLQMLSSTLSRLGVDHTPDTRLRGTQQYRSFAAKVPEVMIYVRQGAPTRNQQRALLGLGFELLYRNMCQQQLPVSARYVMAQVHRLPSVINAAFPGYAEAGLLGMLLTEDVEG